MGEEGRGKEGGYEFMVYEFATALQKEVVVQRLGGGLSSDTATCGVPVCCGSPGTHPLPGRLCCDGPPPLTEAAEADRHWQ